MQDYEPLEIVWTYATWRCGYCWCQGERYLLLFAGSYLALQRRVSTMDEMLFVAAAWRDVVIALPIGMPHAEQDRRRAPANRRHFRQGGRRTTDRQ